MTAAELARILDKLDPDTEVMALVPDEDGRSWSEPITGHVVTPETKQLFLEVKS